MPYLTTEHTRFYYQKFGSGPPAIMLAGMSLDTHYWDKVVDRLQNEMLSIPMDLRGSGRSDAPRSTYSISQMADDVVNFIGEIRLEQPVLVGHSLGGFVALEVALKRPDLVKGLVLISTSAVGKGALLGTSSRAARLLSRTLGPLEKIARATADIGFGSEAKKHGSPITEEFVALRLARPPRGRGFVGQRAAAKEFDLRDKLSLIELQSAVLHGEEDEIINVKNGVFLASSLPRATFYRLHGVGHFPLLEVPDLVAQAIKNLGLTHQS